jgi:hypothetical protein
LPAAAAKWEVGTVEPLQGGQYSSIRVDRYGNAHVSTFSPNTHSLWYGFWDSGAKRWFGTQVDGCSGWTSLALDSQQRPHISYLEWGTGRLKYAHWDGKTWQKQPVMIQAQVVSYSTSIALDAQDRPRISLYEEFGLGLVKTRLRFVSWNGEYWELRTVDSDEGSGKFNCLALNSAGLPRIAYGNVAYQNASLRFAQWNGRGWEVEILEGEGQPGTSMYSVALVVDAADVPHITYTDYKNRLVKYAVKRNGKWHMEVVDSLAIAGYPDRNGLALDNDGNVYISYDDAGNGLLKMAYQKGGRWFSEVVESDHSGFTSCLRVTDDSIWMTYSDPTGEMLRCARCQLPRPARGALGNPGSSMPAKEKEEKKDRW